MASTFTAELLGSAGSRFAVAAGFAPDRGSSPVPVHRACTGTGSVFTFASSPSAFPTYSHADSGSIASACRSSFASLPFLFSSSSSSASFSSSSSSSSTSTPSVTCSSPSPSSPSLPLEPDVSSSSLESSSLLWGNRCGSFCGLFANKRLGLSGVVFGFGGVLLFVFVFVPLVFVPSESLGVLRAETSEAFRDPEAVVAVDGTDVEFGSRVSRASPSFFFLTLF